MERGEIEVSRALQRDKQLNKMLLMAERRGPICWGQLLRDNCMFMHLQMLSQDFFLGRKWKSFASGPKISLRTLLKKKKMVI